MTKPLTSICIPTYNGILTIAQTLDSIITQAFEGLEVVICDDHSSDGTVELVEDYARRFSYIHVVRNENNVGMDRNFSRTALHATGTYLWFCGQDDVFEAGAFAKLREVVGRHPDVDVVYFNYRFMSGDLSREVDPPRLALHEDAYFTSAEDYFRVLDHAPTFLAATVMRRTLWDTTRYEKFFDTHYVQMGVVLQNLSTARVHVVADPRYVLCRIPEDSWKRRGGQMLFEIFSGRLDVWHTVFHSERNPIPAALYLRNVRHFLRNLPVYVISFGDRGFKRTPLIDARMKRVFGSRPLLYWLYVWPLIHLPRSVGALVLKLRRSSVTRWLERSAGRLAASWSTRR